jgi:trimeric autotransporter adhesin
MYQKQTNNSNTEHPHKSQDVRGVFVAFGNITAKAKNSARTLLLKAALIAVAGFIVPSSVYVLLFAPQPAIAQTPNTTVSFQARILLANGALVPDGNYHLEFKIYDDITAGAQGQGVCSVNCLWAETRTTGNLVRVVNGYASVNLGSVTSFPGSMPWGQNLFVTMRVGGNSGSAAWDTEMTNSGNRMKLNAVPYAFTAGSLSRVSGGNTSTLQLTTPTANRTITAPDASGTICLSIGNCAGSGGYGDIINGGNTTGAAVSIGTNDVFGLNLKTNNTTVASLSSSGALVLINSSNSTGAFVIQKSSASDTLFSADTTNNKLVVGNSTGTNANTTLLVLDSATADPTTGYNGASYYNTTSNKFRCYENGAWTDCIAAGGGGSGASSVGAIDTGTYSANGGSIAGSVLYLQTASLSQVGLVSISAQTFNGVKTFDDGLVVTSGGINVSAGGLTVSGNTTLNNNLTVDTNTLFVDSTSNRVGIGTVTPSAKLDINNSATVISSELVTNGSFTGSSTGWNLQPDCSIYGSNKVTVTYSATCQASSDRPALSTDITTAIGGTYKVTFTLSGVSGDTVNMFAYNGSYQSAQFSNGAHTLIFKSDYAGTESIFFEAQNYNTNGTWAIDDVSIVEVQAAPSLVVKDYDGTTILSLGGNTANNLSIGTSTLSANTTGLNNTATGNYVLKNNTVGSDNVATGSYSLFNNISGTRNIAAGLYSLYSNTTGTGNIALGYQAGNNITIGSGNIIIGNDVNASSSSSNNELRIGNGSSILLQGDTTTLAAQFNGDLTVAGATTLNAGLTIAGGTNYGIYYRDASNNVVTTAAGTTNQCLLGSTGAAPVWGACTSGGGVTTLTAIGSSPNANSATISTNTLTLQPADASFGGVVTTGAQNFAGNKTFTGDIVSGDNAATWAYSIGGANNYGYNAWGRANASIAILGGNVVGDTNWRYLVDANGAQLWGDGTAGMDVNLYRSAAATLSTNGNFTAGGNLTVAGTATVGGYNVMTTGSSDTITGTKYFLSNLGPTSGSLTTPPLEAYSTGANAAFMSFHRSGLYAVNFGLDSDNILRIGGWSAPAGVWTLDPATGNQTLAGTLSVSGAVTANAGLTVTGATTIAQTADDSSFTGFVTNDSGVLKYRTVAQTQQDLGINPRTSSALGSATTAGNWYRVATLTGGAGRGAAKIVLTNSGGTGTPNQIIFNVVKDWTTNGTISLISQSGTTCWNTLRLVDDNASATTTYVDAQANAVCLGSYVSVTPEDASAMSSVAASAFTTPAGGAEVTRVTLNIAGNTFAGVSSTFASDNLYRLTSSGISLAGGYTQSGAAANTFTGALTVGGLTTLSTLGAADNNAILCRNTSNQVATCNSAGAGAAFVDGGNAFTAASSIGNTGAFDLAVKTNNVARLTIKADGTIVASNSTLVAGTATSVITGSIDPTASTAVTGVGTFFTTQLVIGDRITLNGETRTVVAIASNTSLTVDIAFSDTANDTTIDKLPALFTVSTSSGAPALVVKATGTTHFGKLTPVNPNADTGIVYANLQNGDTQNQAVVGNSQKTTGDNYAINGTAYGVGANANIGVYGYASGATLKNYAVYSDGTFYNAGNTLFGELAARTISVETRTTNVAGSALTIQGGNAGAGASAFTGGALTLQGGSAAGTGNVNGANVILRGGAGVGTGVSGVVDINTPVFTASALQSIASSLTITQSIVDNNGTILIDATAPGLTITLPAPLNTTIGRVVYVTTKSTSNSYTLAPSGGTSFVMAPTFTATFVWNGTAWTNAGVDGGSSSYIQNQSTISQTANSRITGSAQADTSVITPAVERFTAGTLSVGTTANTNNLTLGSVNSVATTLVGTTINLNTGTIVGNATTQNLFNTVATTLNVGGAATAVNIGAVTGATTVKNKLGVGTAATTYSLEVNSTASINARTIAVNSVPVVYLPDQTPTIFTGSVAFGNGLRSLTHTVATEGNNNTALGIGALLGVTTGENNTGVGTNSLSLVTTGTNNTAVGLGALKSITTGGYNTAVGLNALQANTGTYGVAFGANALYSNTSGADNVSVGVEALYSNTTGFSNTAIGNSALRANVSNSSNTAIGVWAQKNSIGSNNVSVGNNSLLNTTGGQNTAIGFDAFTSAAAYSNSTAIGWNAQPSASNQIMLGNTTVSDVRTYGNLNFVNGGARSISILPQTTTDTVGNALSILGATGNGTGIGGALNLQGGTGGSTNANGGNVVLTGGNGTGTGVSGIVSVTSRLVQQNVTNSTNALQVFDAGGFSLFNLDTVNRGAKLNTNTNTVALDIQLAGASKLSIYADKSSGSFTAGRAAFLGNVLWQDNAIGFQNAILQFGGASMFQSIDTTSKALVVRANSGQSASLLEVQDASGNPYFSVDASGNVSTVLNSTASTTAVCSSLATGTAPTAGTAYQLRDCSGAPVADYAENYPVAAGIDYGDVVTVGTNLVTTYDVSAADNGVVDWTKPLGTIKQLVKSTGAYQSNAIGIVSKNNNNFSSTGYNIKQIDNPMPVALNGRVPVKVTTENGAIQAGDYITTSATQPGYAMKATTEGYVIGQALADYNAATPGKVMVFVKNFYYPGPTQTATLFGTSLTVNGNSLLNGNVSVVGNINVAGAASLANLVVGGSTNLNTLVVAGDTTVQKLTVNGKIISAGPSVTVVLGANATGRSAAVSAIGNDTAGTIVYSAGTSNLPLNPLAAGIQTQVNFSSSYTKAPRIALTPKDSGSATMRYFVETTTTGFAIKFVDTPMGSTLYTFDYIIIE